MSPAWGVGCDRRTRGPAPKWVLQGVEVGGREDLTRSGSRWGWGSEDEGCEREEGRGVRERDPGDGNQGEG